MTKTSPREHLIQDGGDFEPREYEILATWPAGTFVENLAVDATGVIFLSIHSHNRIDRFDPAAGLPSTFAELPAPPMGLAFDSEGQLWITGGPVPQGPGYIWKVSKKGEVELWAHVPDALFMNGCTLHPNGQLLLVCESLTGRILAVDLLKREHYSSWITDDVLKSTYPGYPGANGIKIVDDEVWVSVSGRAHFVHAKIHHDGTPGPLEHAFENVLGDDFAFGSSGSLYVSTHVEQTVMRIDKSGNRSTIAGPEQGAVGATACAFGRTPADISSLYVTTNGGLIVPHQDKIQEAKLLRIEVGEPGLHQ